MKKNRRTSAGNMFSFDGNFYTYTGKAFDIMLISIYWLIGCLPIVTIGASCSALYAAAVKSVRQERGSVTQQFWHAYKQNLLQSVPLTLIYGGVIFLMLLNIGILYHKSNSLLGLFFMVLYLLVIIFIIMSASHVFPVLSRFEMPSGWLVKVSFYMTVKHLPISLIMLVLIATVYLLLLTRPVFVMILPGVLAYVQSYMEEPLLEQHMPKNN